MDKMKKYVENMIIKISVSTVFNSIVVNADLTCIFLD